ncbi:MAG: helix-turn-helix domain-containing protein [Acidobacteriota bacterium]
MRRRYKPSETNQPQTERLLGKRDLAQFLGVSEATITKWVLTGTGPVALRVGAQVRFRMSAVNDYLDRCTVAQKPGEAA